MNQTTLGLIDDKREISWVYSIDPNGPGYQVGYDGITRIECYPECGQMSFVPWLAIYKGDFLHARVDASGMVIIYKQEKSNV